MNLHLFEVALLIHAKEAWENFEGVGWGGIKKKSPSKHMDCLILLCLLVLVPLVETILLFKCLQV